MTVTVIDDDTWVEMAVDRVWARLRAADAHEAMAHLSRMNEPELRILAYREVGS